MEQAVQSNTRQLSNIEARRSIRIKETLPVRWHVRDQDVNGQGKIRNICDAGVMLETKDNLSLAENGILDFELTNQEDSDFLPSAGRVIWLKKEGVPASNVRCGIEFVDPAQDTIQKLRDKIRNRVAKAQSAAKIKNTAGVILFAAMIALMAFAWWYQLNTSQEFQKSTDSLLASSSKQAVMYGEVVQDWKETKALLAEAETQLAQAKEQNAALQTEVSALLTVKTSLENSIALLKEQNTNLAKELDIVKEKLKPFEGAIANIQDGKSSMKIVRSRLREIKLGIKDINRKAWLDKIAALKELDKLKLARGNRGFVIKDGKPFEAPPEDLQPAQPPQEQPAQKFDIDVNLY